MTEEYLMKKYEDLFVSSLKNEFPNFEFELEGNDLVVKPWFNEPFSKGKINMEKLKTLNIPEIENAINTLISHHRNVQIESVLFEFKN